MRIAFRMVTGCVLLLLGLTGCNGKAGQAAAPAGAVRTYYVAAEDLPWDYAPTGENQITGVPFANLSSPNPLRESEEFVMTRRVAFDPISSAAGSPNFTTDSAAVQIGTTYRKTLFVEYTSASFTVKKPRPAQWAHLGVLGPALRAEVGDTIRVVFKNKSLTGHSFTMHPHGVFYDKASEGTPYVGNDPNSFSAGNNVPPGGTFTYEWQVPDRAGPGPTDGPSVQWMYHSHFDETEDFNSGLVGPMIIYEKGRLRPDGSVVGIDREFVTMFALFDENASWHFSDNLATFGKLTQNQIEAAILGPPGTVDPSMLVLNGFTEEPNLKHAINGFIFGNLPLESLTMRKGEKIRWYLFAMGSETDLHTPHWHGNTALVRGGRSDVVDLLPATMVTADMVPDNVGTWLFHCQVNDHLDAGMVARYRVEP